MLPAVEIPAVSLAQKEDQVFEEPLELAAGARAGREAAHFAAARDAGTHGQRH